MIRELRLLGEFIEKRRAAVPYISAHICGGERGTLERSDKGEEWRTVMRSAEIQVIRAGKSVINVIKGLD